MGTQSCSAHPMKELVSPTECKCTTSLQSSPKSQALRITRSKASMCQTPWWRGVRAAWRPRARPLCMTHTSHQNSGKDRIWCLVVAMRWLFRSQQRLQRCSSCHLWNLHSTTRTTSVSLKTQHPSKAWRSSKSTYPRTTWTPTSHKSSSTRLRHRARSLSPQVAPLPRSARASKSPARSQQRSILWTPRASDTLRWSTIKPWKSTMLPL